jgi:hypothetical protein
VSVLVERLFGVHDSLEAAGIPHAFGGAIALAYCTNDPRGTRDLDINIFLPVEDASDVLRRLPGQVKVEDDDLKTVLRDGQVRLRWKDTPVDLFFNNLPFHEVVARGVIEVPLEGRTIPVLDASSLVVFKAMFDRTRDWADIESVVEWDRESAADGLAKLADLVGTEEQIYKRLEDLIN